MSETIRSIRVQLEVDTNKQTHHFDEQVGSLPEAVEAVQEWIEELRL